MVVPDGEAQALAAIAQLERRCEIVDSRFEDRKIRWHRIGAGSPLVLLHGGNGSWLHWVRNIEALAEQHELWLPDLPGCGDSHELPPPANLERLVAALHAA
ncbi:MAG TPA: alpha/beta fold hydrolase, partial [Ramlibacter sp.]|nr:alpha/beta fold hydrolase [Ramlibacter sp.]